MEKKDQENCLKTDVNYILFWRSVLQNSSEGVSHQPLQESMFHLSKWDTNPHRVIAIFTSG